jgi:hypothetical protein
VTFFLCAAGATICVVPVAVAAALDSAAAVTAAAAPASGHILPPPHDAPADMTVSGAWCDLALLQQHSHNTVLQLLLPNSSLPVWLKHVQQSG